MKDKKIPAIHPGRPSGNIISLKMLKGLAPKFEAASISFVSIDTSAP